MKHSRKTKWFNQWWLQYKKGVIILFSPVLFLFLLFVIIYSAGKVHTKYRHHRATQAFNEAQTKLKQLTLPVASTTEYINQCTKPQSEGWGNNDPVCIVSRVDEFIAPTDRQQLTEQLNQQFIQYGANKKPLIFSDPNNSIDSGVLNNRVELTDFVKGLECFSEISNQADSKNILLTTSCLKIVPYTLF